MQSRLDPALVLTNRRVDILRRLAEGRSPFEISKDLGISVATVYEHLEAIRRRLRAHSNPEAIRIAIRHGFVPGED
jgi:DNA-binding CsgD family transcriptional regulator